MNTQAATMTNVTSEAITTRIRECLQIVAANGLTPFRLHIDFNRNEETGAHQWTLTRRDGGPLTDDGAIGFNFATIGPATNSAWMWTRRALQDRYPDATANELTPFIDALLDLI